MKSSSSRRACIVTSAILYAISSATALAQTQIKAETPGIHFEFSFPPSARTQPVTGRVFLFVSRDKTKEPRLDSSSLFGVDVHAAGANQAILMDGATAGAPEHSLSQLAPGDYQVQAVLNIYTEFHRADGHTIWAHMDQWDGQNVSISPGNLVSAAQTLHLDPNKEQTFKFSLDKVNPAIIPPPDTEFVKHIKFESKLLSQFWGRSIYIGATILLPRGYSTHPDATYPVLYLQGHFNLGAPFGFTTEPDKPGTRSWARLREEWAANHIKNMHEPPPGTQYNGALMNVESGYEFYQSWNSDAFPRMIAVTFQHPTPYFDDSYGVNSPNAGPYGDAIMNELIPDVEKQFRIIRQPFARVLSGGSTGGWGALAMQVYHPEFFGGTWSFYPDPVDFHRYYGGVDIYEDDNAFAEKPGRIFAGGGNSNREISRHLSVLGTQDAGFEWDKHTPVGADGYPKPLWDLTTGKIDHQVALAMKANGYDLHDYLEKNWVRIGPQLVGKIHIFFGDEDDGYSNLAAYLLENYLEGTKQPYYAGSFEYGRPMKGHGWQPTTNAELVKKMAAHIVEYSPAQQNADSWHY